MVGCLVSGLTHAVDDLGLARKAEVFEHDLHERFSLDGQILCKLKLPTPQRDFVAYNMPDNAYMTGMVLGALSLKYAVTKDPADREAARRSLRALHLLCTVSGRAGLLARAAWPKDRPMDDDGVWRESADGKYLWRGDVSSDQVDGVMYGLALAYDHVATEEDKALIARDVAAMVDHIIENRLRIIDANGEPTQWGSYYRDYVTRREPMNALLWLQHLKTAEHVTGDPRYAETYRRYALDEGYARIAVESRRHGDPMDPRAVNHSDDVLLYLAYYPLLDYETDPQLRALYLESLRRTWEGDGRRPGVKPENNPFFAFITRKFLGNDIDTGPSVQALRIFPLDMKWERTTIDRYARQFHFQFDSAPVSPPGTLGQAVPLDRRVKSWSAWVMDPYLEAGERPDGHALEYNGHDYLVAYWLGRYEGFIGPED